MKLMINDIVSLNDCREAAFLFQAFKIKTIEYVDLDKEFTLAKIKIFLEKSNKDTLYISLKTNKLTKQLSLIYKSFYQKIDENDTCWLELSVSDYKDFIYDTSDLDEVHQVINDEVSNLFSKTKLTYLPNDLISLIGMPSNESQFIEVGKSLERLQEKRENYEFIDKAPMDIGIMIVVGASILGVQSFLWNRIGIAMNTYFYAQQYSSFFWTFGITSIVFLIIILLLFIPLFFSLRSGLRDLIKWCRIKKNL